MIKFPASLFGVFSALAATPASAADVVDFERDVRPIFAEKCTLCHGPDDAKGGLRLTNLDNAGIELESGNRAIVPGKIDASSLIERINHSDPDEIMPPPDKAEPLTDGEKKLLKQWIAQGADWPRHWAYEPLSQKAPPEVKAPAATIRNPIDQYVLARLAEKNITPSPGATPETLIRRLSYDLVGLPPEPAEVAAFLKACAGDPEKAYTDLVDRLLASPRFGERWGRHWLDKARYADSDGYEKDNNRPNAWRYRDWVIDAINRDLPFDQFTIEQLAGDLLADADENQNLATAFNRQTLTNTEGGTDKEQWRVAAVMDRTETLGAVWLGLTVGCARCHTHKYDEITHHDYYSLYAYFNNGDETNTKVRRTEAEWAQWEKDHAAYLETFQAKRQQQSALINKVSERIPEWEKAIRAQIASAREADTRLQDLNIEEAKPPKDVVFKKLDDGSYLATGKNPETATYTLTGELPAGTYNGLRLDVLSDESLPAKGPGRVKHGNFVLNHLRLTLDGKAITFGGARADYSQANYPVQNALDPNVKANKDGTGWAVGSEYGKDHHAEFGFADTVTLDQPAKFTIQLVQNYGSSHTIGRFKLSAITGATDLIVPDDIRNIIAKPGTGRSKEESHRLRDYYAASVAPETRALAAAIDQLQASQPKAPALDVRVISQRSTDARTTHIFRRGEFKEPLDAVEPGTPATLPPIEHRAETGDRLDLARWLVNGQNPLPPRVAVNHIWAYLFGAGIVPTMNDFGVRGDRPSHPELLDWLAGEFIRLDWSGKNLIRTIVHSSTYRQSSDHRPELADIDPKNELLARQNRFRVDAEIIRDVSLAAAGLLSDKIGGPSVFPPMPDGVADVNYNSAFKWKVSENEDRYRRGLYTFFKRTAPHPTLMTFDCPDSNVTSVQRTRSNTPLAALVTLNNEVFREAAVGLARRVLEEKPGADDAGKIAHAFSHTLTRTADATEQKALSDLLARSRAYYQANPEAATQLLGELPAAAGTKIPPAELAAWTATLRVLLNLDEFLTRS